MPIVGALVARGSVILAEYCPPGVNFPTIARKLAAQIPTTPDSKNSYSYEAYNFNYLVEGGITYICMTDNNTKLRIAYEFLNDLNNRFKGTYRGQVQTAESMAMNDSFSRIMKERLEFFSNERNVDKISKVQGEIQDTKQIMVQSIEKVLERGDRIEMLVSKTEDLHTQATSFKKKSTGLKRKMWWQNFRYTCVVVIIILVLLSIGILFALWHFGVLDKIFKSSHHNPGSTTTGFVTSSDIPMTTGADVTTQFLTTSDLTTSEMTTSEITSSEITSSEIEITSAAVTSADDAITSSSPSLTGSD